MTLAEKKRENNLSEYLIHMFQTEDLIRSFEFDLERIEKNLISLLPVDESRKKIELEWYKVTVQQMKEEKIENSGHLKAVLKDIAAIEHIYKNLEQADADFKNLIDAANPLFEKSSQSEVMTCLQGMYGYLILKTDDLPVPEQTELKANLYGQILSYLSFKFKQGEYLNEN